MASGLIPGTPVGQLFSWSSQPSTPTLQDIQENNLGGVSSGHAMSHLHPENSQIHNVHFMVCAFLRTIENLFQKRVSSYNPLRAPNSERCGYCNNKTIVEMCPSCLPKILRNAKGVINLLQSHITSAIANLRYNYFGTLPRDASQLGAKKSTQTFFVQSFSKTLRVMDVRAENRGRPHQKVHFSAAPVMGRNFLTQGRPGVRVRNVRGKSGPKSLCLCCFFFPDQCERQNV